MKFICFLIVTILSLGFTQQVFAAELGNSNNGPALLSAWRSITFPAVGKVTYRDDFSEPRSGGRTHEGNDIIGPKMTPLVSAVDGTITFLTEQQASWGYSLSITDSDGYEYNYLHINNDSPGTDNGQGGINFAFAPAIKLGQKVKAGDFLGWMGDSGNAEETVPHLHFEIRAPGGIALNPYQSLQTAVKISDTALPALAYSLPLSLQADAGSPAQPEKISANPKPPAAIVLLKTPQSQVEAAQKKIDSASTKKQPVLKQSSPPNKATAKKTIKKIVKPQTPAKSTAIKTKTN